MKAVFVIVGARPEAIKMAPVYWALKQSATLRPVLVATGQHRQMLDQTLSVFGLRPDLDLDLMRLAQTLVDLTSRALTALAEVMRLELPAASRSYGDRVKLERAEEALAATSVMVRLVNHSEFRAVDRQVLAQNILVDTRGFWR